MIKLFKSLIDKVYCDNRVFELQQQLDYAKAANDSMAKSVRDATMLRDIAIEQLSQLKQGIPVIVIKPELI